MQVNKKVCDVLKLCSDSEQASGHPCLGGVFPEGLWKGLKRYMERKSLRYLLYPPYGGTSLVWARLPRHTIQKQGRY